MPNESSPNPRNMQSELASIAQKNKPCPPGRHANMPNVRNRSNNTGMQFCLHSHWIRLGVGDEPNTTNNSFWFFSVQDCRATQCRCILYPSPILLNQSNYHRQELQRLQHFAVITCVRLCTSQLHEQQLLLPWHPRVEPA